MGGAGRQARDVRVIFWGVRGSIPTPDEPQARYGGNTPCVQVSCSDGTLFSLDGGMGLRWMSVDLMQGKAGRGEEHLHLLLTHCHWDHIQGIPFSPIMYASGNRVTIHGRRGFEGGLKETLLHQLKPSYCPVPNFFLHHDVGATVEFHEIDAARFHVGPVRITSLELPRGNRPTCSGYRLEHDGVSLVYMSDVEYPEGQPGLCAEALELARGADLLIHDAQFLPEEVSQRPNWGHSTYLEALELGRLAGCRRVALYHHEPARTDDELDALGALAREQAGGADVFVAREGMLLDV